MGRKGAVPKNRSPAFQWYPKDFLADENVAVMGMAARGVYITLLSHCWLEGTIPREIEKLALLCSLTPRAMAKIWPEVEPCFRKSGKARLYHERLRREKRKQVEHTKAKSKAGAAGGKAKAANRLASTATKVPLAESSSAVSALHAAAVTKKATPASAPAAAALNPQQERVRRVQVLLPDVKPGMAAKWLKLWGDAGMDDAAMEDALRSAVQLYPGQSPNYIGQVLETARKNGGKILKSGGAAKRESEAGWRGASAERLKRYEDLN